MVPSWKISVASGDRLPARVPPMSQKCPLACEKATISPSTKIGTMKCMSGEWVTPPFEP